MAHSGARRRLVSSTIRDESAHGARARPRTRGPHHRRSHSAMCCAQLDALQVEKRIGVSGSRTHLASGTASGPPRHGGVQTYSFLFHEVLLLIGPLPLTPFYFHLCSSATRDRATRYSQIDAVSRLNVMYRPCRQVIFNDRWATNAKNAVT